MCGRFSQHYTWAQIHAFSTPVGAPAPVANLRARYNIAPTTDVQMLVGGESGSDLKTARWGLVPGWWKKPLRGMPATFNARVETVDTSPMFRDAYKRRRCIIPASGFFEWTGPKDDRLPHYFSAADGGVLAFAGLWDRWRSPDGEETLSCTIVVGPADDWMARYHDRRPMVLPTESLAGWLDGSMGKDDLLASVPVLQEWTVSQRVNKAGVGDDDPATIAPV